MTNISVIADLIADDHWEHALNLLKQQSPKLVEKVDGLRQESGRQKLWSLIQLNMPTYARYLESCWPAGQTSTVLMWQLPVMPVETAPQFIDRVSRRLNVALHSDKWNKIPYDISSQESKVRRLMVKDNCIYATVFVVKFKKSTYANQETKLPNETQVEVFIDLNETPRVAEVYANKNLATPAIKAFISHLWGVNLPVRGKKLLNYLKPVQFTESDVATAAKKHSFVFHVLGGPYHNKNKSSIGKALFTSQIQGSKIVPLSESEAVVAAQCKEDNEARGYEGECFHKIDSFTEKVIAIYYLKPRHSYVRFHGKASFPAMRYMLNAVKPFGLATSPTPITINQLSKLQSSP